MKKTVLAMVVGMLLVGPVLADEYDDEAKAVLDASRGRVSYGYAAPGGGIVVINPSENKTGTILMDDRSVGRVTPGGTVYGVDLQTVTKSVNS